MSIIGSECVVRNIRIRNVNLQGLTINLREVIDENGIPKPTDTLVIFLGPFNIPEKAINRYCDLYHERGFTVLYIPGVMSHKNAWKLANLLPEYLKSNTPDYRHMFIHAICVGTYIFILTLENMRAQGSKYNKTILEKIRCVVVDSMPVFNYRNVSYGAALILSNNAIIQIILAAIIYILLVFSTDMVLFTKAFENFIRHPLNVPTLIFHSENDTLADTQHINDMVGKWREMMSSAVVTQFWKESVHAAHLRMHPEEYVQTLRDFHDSIPEVMTNMNKISKL